MNKGDHITVHRGSYWHHGVALGNKEVAQYGADVGGKAHAAVEVTTIASFSRGNDVRIVKKEARFSPEEIVERALSQVGEKNYSLIFRNCECFVNWCRIGRRYSRQSDRILERNFSACAKMGVRGLSRLSFKTAGKALPKSITRVGTPWILVADGAQFVTECAAYKVDLDEESAKRTGQAIGLGASAAIGGKLAGLPGVLAATALWASGEVIGQCATALLTNRSEFNRKKSCGGDEAESDTNSNGSST